MKVTGTAWEPCWPTCVWTHSRESVEAIYFVTRLWNILMEDLASPENGLPQELRANLISIGIWVLKEAERLRSEESDNFSGLVQVCETIRDGL